MRPQSYPQVSRFSIIADCRSEFSRMLKIALQVDRSDQSDAPTYAFTLLLVRLRAEDGRSQPSMRRGILASLHI